MIKKIFFSYSREDGSEFSLRLAQDLKNAGFNIWIDQQNIRAGTEWDIEIGKALETSDCLLFIESEKSVVSNNVLDEVYFALDHQKKVIPVIYHDSKTPYRLQRLQHIDFSKNYDEGLSSLTRELKGDFRPQMLQEPGVLSPKPFNRKYIYFGGGFLVAIAITFAAFFIQKKDHPHIGDSHFVKNENITIDSTVPKRQNLLAEEDIAVSDNRPSKQINNKPDNKNNNRAESNTLKNKDVEGDWRLTDVEPRATSHLGYLKIGMSDGDKVDIKTTSQFYYPQTSDTSFLSVFNVIANCSSCTLQREMQLKTEDIAVGSQTYRILKHDSPGIGKAGDTVMNAGANKSIRGTIMLHFVDRNHAVISVSSGKPVELSYGLVMPAFKYTFRFEKLD